MKKKQILLLLTALLMPLCSVLAQSKVNAKAYYTDTDGYQQEATVISDGQAPLDVTFRANPIDMDDVNPSYEWHFTKANSDLGYDEFLVRYEEDTQYTFAESGAYVISLKVFENRNGESVLLDSVAIGITISESVLEFPNAFSPNGDGINDEYKAKKGYKSIVEFHAYIFNRWGQKLYEWTDVSKGWDGKYNGNDVRDGVYFVLVKAKGADGKKYNIRRDVNLLRGYNKSTGSDSSNSGTTTE